MEVGGVWEAAVEEVVGRVVGEADRGVRVVGVSKGGGSDFQSVNFGEGEDRRLSKGCDGGRGGGGGGEDHEGVLSQGRADC